MTVKGFITFEDASGELARTNVNLPAGTTPSAAFTALDAIATELVNGGAINGRVLRYGFSEQSPPTVSSSADPSSVRELKILVVYEDTQEFLDPGTDSVPNPGFGRRYRLEVPTAVPSIQGANDEIDTGGTELSGFVTDFEANAVSPTGGSVSILSARIVGRNL